MTGVRRAVRYWGRDVLMLSLVVLAFVLLLGTRSETTRQCERTRKFAPYVARFYQAHHVMPPRVLHAYRETIPKGC